MPLTRRRENIQNIRSRSPKSQIQICRMEDQQHPLHFKIKRNIMNKFLSEPVDALDLRLTKAEALLDGNLVDDPWKVKSERDEEGDRGSVVTVSDER